MRGSQQRCYLLDFVAGIARSFRSCPMRLARAVILISAFATAAGVTLAGPVAGASGRAGAPGSAGQGGAVRAAVVYPDLRLPDGRRALVYSDGLAEVSG